jgi:hypothetical protein
MSYIIEAGSQGGAVRFVTKAYARFLLAGFALVPAYLILYLYYFQDPTLKFENHIFHEIAIAVATLEGLFVTYVTWRCYRASGEALLRWMTFGFLGFVVIYALHGASQYLALPAVWPGLAAGHGGPAAGGAALIPQSARRRKPAGETPFMAEVDRIIPDY